MRKIFWVFILVSICGHIYSATLLVPSQYQKIQEAINTSSDGDTIIVSPGTYRESVHFYGKNITLRSTDPENTTVVESTIIMPANYTPTITFSGDELSTCVLAGFTIQDGTGDSYWTRAGIYGYSQSSDIGTKATIRNNILSNNGGYGIYYCDGLIIGNIIRRNSYSGISCCDGNIEYNTISDNGYNGLSSCHAYINGNVISGHSNGQGGGLNYCSGTITNNTITKNSAYNDESGGGGMAFCSGIIRGNIITNNSADNTYSSEICYGGGMYKCDGIIEDNLINGNSAKTGGGGLAYCSGQIRNNLISNNSATTGGGIFDIANSDISNNNILENVASYRGGGIAWVNSGIISFNIISGNTGGAIYNCSSDIKNNIITKNYTKYDGGGIYAGDGNILYNIISYNTAKEKGGGLMSCNNMINCNLIYKNLTYGTGGGADSCIAIIINNTIVNNSANGTGGGLNSCDKTAYIVNNILWGNSGSSTGGIQINSSNPPQYSCIQDWTGSGTGNISFNPNFVDPGKENFHIGAGSPCIDKGNIFYCPNTTFWDIDNEGRISGVNVDIGCDEFGSSKDTDGDGLIDNIEITNGSDINNTDSDGDGLWDGAENLRNTNPCIADLPTTLTIPLQYPSIQQAIYLAFTGEAISVSPGEYKENLNLNGKNIILTGINPSDSLIRDSIIINGQNIRPVISLAGTEDETCEIRGFTITNGSGSSEGSLLGAGINGKRATVTIMNNKIISNHGAGIVECNGLIDNNIISLNSSTSASYYGGGVFYCSGLISNNIITKNSSRADGGGISGNYGGQIINNIISENSSSSGGGGIANGNSTIYNNEIVNNKALQYGGGISGSMGPISENRISQNSADEDGGGIYNSRADILNNEITLNKAGENGGGICRIDGNIWGNTISGNSANGDGGGIYNSSADILYNEIKLNKTRDNGGGICRIDGNIWGNTISGNSADYGGGIYSCTGGLTDNIIGYNYVQYDGGGIYDYIGNIENNTMSYNSSTGSGGAIYKGKGAMINNTITHNSGVNGGGIYGYSGTIYSNDICDNSASISGGGIFQNNGSICENIVSRNSANYGGGIAYCITEIRNNTVNENSAGNGGGIYFCKGTLSDNTICYNYSNFNGGAVYNYDGCIKNNILSYNSSNVSGGAIYNGYGILSNNCITYNSGFDGGGFSNFSGIVSFSTICNNSASGIGGGLNSVTNSLILNCIIWGNSSQDNSQISLSSTPIYSCILDSPSDGVGNFSADPLFIDSANNNFHLSSASPCMDKANYYYFVNEAMTDVEGFARVYGASADLGCYEQGSSKDSDGDFLSDVDELSLGTDPLKSDTDTDGLWDFAEIKRGLDPGTINIPSEIDIPTTYTVVQKGIFLAIPGETINIGKGIYYENLNLGGKNLILQSSLNSNQSLNNSTIIDAGGTGPVIKLLGTENETCIIQGLIFRNGNFLYGGGVSGNIDYSDDFPKNTAVFRNNIMYKNTGGAYYRCYGKVLNSTICYNSGIIGFSGEIFGGFYQSTLNVENCIIKYSGSLGNITPRYSCIDTGTAGVGCIQSDPALINPDADDFHLMINSPCIDAGNPDAQYNDASLPPGLGTVRSDMGAYSGPYNYLFDMKQIGVYYIREYLMERNIVPSFADMNKDGRVDVSDIIYLLDMDNVKENNYGKSE